ncbi:glycogen synthesis protein GlgS [Pseudescherichia vulneris]|uniref:glycogen synthesis protein GlgS n=1 Tax=Pseudescherichia vulneris TaxID=566 RepID=UPI00227B9CD1|nr:glycogen synthesis protein GlgS [Pseudescherichia vulneris]WAH52793.1 glycogen synthesis protein GlgS [Pseudescherichia vulneris]
MQLVGQKYVVSSGDLDFIAYSFAQMRSQGRHLCTEAITGNMDNDCKALFLQRYDRYLEQLKEDIAIA